MSGARAPVRRRQPGKPGPGKSQTEHPTVSSVHTLSTIEALPTEILEMIYFDSGNPWLVFASPELYSKLDSTRNRKKWIERAFDPVPVLTQNELEERSRRDYPPAVDEKKDAIDDRIQEFGCIASQPWFMRCVDRGSPTRLINPADLNVWITNNDVGPLFVCQRRWNQNFGNFFMYMRRKYPYLSSKLRPWAQYKTSRNDTLRAIDEFCCPALALLVRVPFHHFNTRRCGMLVNSPGLAHYAPDEEVYASNPLVPSERWVQRWATMPADADYQMAPLCNAMDLDPVCHALELRQDFYYTKGFVLAFLEKFGWDMWQHLKLGPKARNNDNKVRALLKDKAFRPHWGLLKKLLGDRPVMQATTIDLTES